MLRENAELKLTLKHHAQVVAEKYQAFKMKYVCDLLLQLRCTICCVCAQFNFKRQDTNHDEGTEFMCSE